MVETTTTMNTFLWTSLIFAAAAVIALVRATRGAPLGFEDSDGFHVDREARPVMAVVDTDSRHRIDHVAAGCR